MAETVVDDLEPVQIEIQDRESVGDAAPLALVETASEPLDEHRAVEETGERILEADAPEALLCDGLLGRVSERACDAIGLP